MTTQTQKENEYLEFINSTYLDQEVIEAGRELGIPLESIEDAYQGHYCDAVDFAKHIADENDLIDHNAAWPMNCVDWKLAARELMYDFCEANFHYFNRD